MSDMVTMASLIVDNAVKKQEVDQLKKDIISIKSMLISVLEYEYEGVELCIVDDVDRYKVGIMDGVQRCIRIVKSVEF